MLLHPLHFTSWAVVRTLHCRITQRALGDLILVEEGVLRAVESLRGTGDVSDTATSVSLDEEFGCMTELLDDFILNMGNLLAEARLARRRSEMDQELVTLRIARERNMILRIGLLIQLITLLLAANSMISGWFGAWWCELLCGRPARIACLSVCTCDSACWRALS